MQDRGSKSTHVGSAMTTSTKVQMPSLVNTMSIHRQKEFNMFEGSTCSYFHPTWKLASCTMAAKVLQTTSLVLMHSLSWTQCKRWIPIRLMECVHMHWSIPAIERWGSPTHIRSVVEKIREVNRKFGKISWIVSQTPTLGPKHDIIQAWWVLDIPSKSMLKKYDGVNALRWNLEVELIVV